MLFAAADDDDHDDDENEDKLLIVVECNGNPSYAHDCTAESSLTASRDRSIFVYEDEDNVVTDDDIEGA